MAYFGKFQLIKVMFYAFFGTLLADQLLFYIGRFVGVRLLSKFKKLEKKSAYIIQLLEAYDVPFILGFRFVYGIRIISPFFIGLSNISIPKFSILNLIAALIWSIFSCTLGYYIGAFSRMLGSEKMYITVIFNVVVTLFIILLFHFISRKVHKKVSQKLKK
jgi:membrane protein DedA with SNARE-associated domain